MKGKIEFLVVHVVYGLVLEVVNHTKKCVDNIVGGVG